MSGRRRVVITGMGLISPIGLGVEAFRASLEAGRSGVHTFRRYDPAALPVRFGGEIEEFDARRYVDKKDRKSLKLMPHTAQLAVAGARLALDEGGLKQGDIDPLRLGVMMGTGIIPGELADLGPAAQACYDATGEAIDLHKWGRYALPLIAPTWMLNHVPNLPACHAAILNDAQGPNNTLTQFDAAALFAVGEACRTIERGAADAMLAGGADTRTGVITVARFLLFSKLSHRNHEPELASRPFALDREGQVLSEGAGVLLLEDRDHAARRGRKVLAEVGGFASGFDRGKTGRGLVRAIRTVLDTAGITPADLDHVNAAALGLDDDAWEARAIRETLGEVEVLAMKSYLGNAGNGASCLELAASVLALNEGTVPMSLNASETDPACPVRLVRERRLVRKPWVLKLAWTERGQCAAVVIRREG